MLTPKPETVDEELGYRQADAAGDAQAATNLGVLLEKKGDLKGAVAAYRRADRRGDVNGSFNLGCLLAEMGDVRGAKAALRRADERGDACGASNLGVLLERQGDPDGALAAYRRADERGDAVGAFNLGLLLAASGDIAGARAAYLRAAERGDPEVRDQALAQADTLPPDAGPAATTEADALTSETADIGEVNANLLREAFWYEQASAFKAPGDGDRSIGQAPLTAHPEVGPVAHAEPAGQTEPARLWISHTSRTQWVAALGVLALFGLVVVLVGRGLRRLS